MGVKDVKLKKGMTRDEVNKLLEDNDVALEFVDDGYINAHEKHNWKCECSEEFFRSWNCIKNRDSINCKKCVRGIKENYDDISQVYLEKSMTKEEVNELISEWILLDDDIYMGINFKHSWICLKCGKSFQRRWHNIKYENSEICKDCIYKEQENRYKYEVEKDGDYEYIRSFRSGDMLSGGEIVSKNPYLQVKHKYCGSIYDVKASSFINENQRCSRCCQKYENSFAYHIEVELGEPLDKYWDSDKNTANPYLISKNRNSNNKYKKNIKVWIKCTETDYHGSYEVSCANFANRNRCPYCTSRKVHSLDSFGQWLKDNELFHLWSSKNAVDPFVISKQHNGEIWMLCGEKEYHNDYCGYKISCANFINGHRCPYCVSRKVHPLDSFGKWMKDNNLLHLWSSKNGINPFNLSTGSDKKVFMLCEKVEYHNDYGGYEISCYSFVRGQRCSYCWNRTVHPYDSFGYHNFDKVQSWHPDNKISPFRVANNSGEKHKFICETCDNEWVAMISNINNGTWCPRCNSSKGEKRIEKWLMLHDIKYQPEKTFDNLVSDKSNLLRYDFYLTNSNLLIEYQGQFHDNTIAGSYKSDFEKQKEHDRRKKEYAKNNNIELLEIWYWDFDNVEKILSEKLKINKTS